MIETVYLKGFFQLKAVKDIAVIFPRHLFTDSVIRNFVVCDIDNIPYLGHTYTVAMEFVVFFKA